MVYRCSIGRNTRKRLYVLVIVIVISLSLGREKGDVIIQASPDSSPSIQIFVVSYRNTTSTMSRTAFIIQNGTNVCYKNLLIINLMNKSLSYDLWESGSLPPFTSKEVVYPGISKTVNFAFYSGSRIYISGTLRFTAKNLDVVEEFDIGILIKNYPGFIVFLVVSGILALLPGKYLGTWYKKRQTSRVQEI